MQQIEKELLVYNSQAIQDHLKVSNIDGRVFNVQRPEQL
jgi:hypothetical protein